MSTGSLSPQSSLAPPSPSRLTSALRRNKRSRTNLVESKSKDSSLRSSTGSLDLTASETHSSVGSVLSTREKVAGVFRRRRKHKAGESSPSTESLEIRKTVTAEVRREDENGQLVEQTDGAEDSDEVYDEDSDGEAPPQPLKHAATGYLTLEPASSTSLSTPSRRSTSPTSQPSTTPKLTAASNGSAASLSSRDMSDSQRPASADADSSKRNSLGLGDRRTARGKTIGTSTLPVLSTPSNTAEVNPKTTVTPPTPTDPASFLPPIVSGAHRRARGGSLSNTPSKLSQSMNAPLTPTSEGNTPSATPGAATTAIDTTHALAPASGANTPQPQQPQGGPAGGFFSNMVSAAQNAATNITTLATTAIKMNNQSDQGRLRSGSGTGVLSEQEERELNEKDSASRKSSESTDSKAEPKKKLAVETLGMGELSLGTLGLASSPTPGSADTSSTFGGTFGGVNDTRTTLTDSTPITKPVPAATLNEKLMYNTPPGTRTALNEDVGAAQFSTSQDMKEFKDEVRRSGSIRSLARAGDAAGMRKRGGSAASQALSQISQNGISSPQTPKPTGFAVATKKRNREFHMLFRSVPEDDYLIEDYGAALQREILLQGRFYVSEGHICFHSNIFGWVNTLVISFNEVVAVEKKSTALVFPNAIVIQTLHARHVFASFINRDATFDLVIAIWRITHPSLKTSLNGVSLDKGAELKAIEDAAERDGSSASDESEEYDEDEEFDDDGEDGDEFADAGDSGDAGTDASKRGSSGALISPDGGATAPPAVDFPGPPGHAPTTCTDSDAHYDRELCDEIIPAPMGRVYALVFGAQSSKFISQLLLDDGNRDLIMPPTEWPDIDPNSQKKTRSLSYIKPLNNGIGPKQTKCILTETLEILDFESQITVTVSTSTPDVPSGNSFTVKTRYCFMWAPNNQTRLIMNCAVEWTGKSWLKGPIEKGCNDGQTAYTASLLAALRKEVAPIAVGTKSKKKGGRKRKGTDTPSHLAPTTTTTIKKKGPEPASGPFEMVRSLVAGLFGGNAIGLWAIIIVLLLISLYYRKNAQAQAKPGCDFNRAFEREEEDLWRWLEDRLGEGAGVASAAAKSGLSEMNVREIREAVGVMQGRLERLREVVGEN